MPAVARRAKAGAGGQEASARNSTDHHSPITDHRSPITGHPPPTTDHRSPITDYRSPTTARRAAYTLIEQIMVMLIIGIVLAMVIGLSRYVNQRGNRALARSEIELWHQAVHAFANHYGRVPDNQEETKQDRFLVLCPPGFSVEDPWGNAYEYEQLSAHAFRVFSAGPDGQPGNEDDVHAD